MISIKGVSLQSLSIGLRWCRLQGFPENMAEWDSDHNFAFQWICEEIDRRRIKRLQKQNEDWCF